MSISKCTWSTVYFYFSPSTKGSLQIEQLWRSIFIIVQLLLKLFTICLLNFWWNCFFKEDFNVNHVQRGNQIFEFSEEMQHQVTIMHSISFLKQYTKPIWNEHTGKHKMSIIFQYTCSSFYIHDIRNADDTGMGRNLFLSSRSASLLSLPQLLASQMAQSSAFSSLLHINVFVSILFPVSSLIPPWISINGCQADQRRHMHEKAQGWRHTLRYTSKDTRLP